MCRHLGNLQYGSLQVVHVVLQSGEMYVNIRPVFRFRFVNTTVSSSYFLKCHYRSGRPTKLLSSQNYRQPAKKKKRKLTDINESEVDDSSNYESELDELLDRHLLPAESGRRVFVIQPYIKWGIHKKRNTTPELQLLESVSLIKTLRQWTVVDKRIVSLQYVREDFVFGSGILSTLKGIVRCNPDISAVFISLNTLSLKQQVNLQKVFQVPIFDRYSIVLNIFKEHAQTKEAKLQIRLAQLPYLYTVLEGFGHGLTDKWGLPESYLGGTGPRLLTDRREIFRKRAADLKKEILELRQHRTSLRKKREKQEIPVVAVIGYTNAGKTSLIKALTGKESLEPQDYLFATLDVTSHLGVLPSGLQAYFIDTLGFISDIPTYLIESFVSTLEDAVLATLIVHVRDVSHPDTVAQNDKVIEILNDLKIPETTIKNIITVGNKIDLVDKKDLANYKDMILVSSTNMTGINFLRLELEKKILQLSDLTRIVIRVESGSPEYCWLYENATVVKDTPDPKDNQYTFVETLISPVCLSKFKHYFIKNHKR